jgi:hypothetical protein
MMKRSSALGIIAAAARVGRPLTPMSVAGVNRRVHRRAYYGAAAAGAGYYAATEAFAVAGTKETGPD